MQAKLIVNTDPYLIGGVADFTFKWALNAGLSVNESSRVTMAVNELATDIVLFAYPDGVGEYEVLFEQKPNYLEIILTETGIPFDPDRHRYNKKKALKSGDFDGAGFEIIKRMTDDFVFLNHGKEGKEFRIVKKLPEGQIIDLTPEQDEEEVDKQYQYRLCKAKPSDAESISKLIYRVYKNTYTKDVMYYPKMVERAIKHKQRFGVMIKTQEDDVVGFFAILRNTDSLIGEIGEAAVDIKHRQKGLMNQMIHELIDIAKSKGLLGIYGEAVTVHPVSQKVNYKFNMGSTALLLGMFPNALYTGLNETTTQNVSVVIDFLYLSNQEERYLYLPSEYSRIIKEIYKNLGLTAHNIRNHNKGLLKGITETDLIIDYEGENATLVIKRFGEDFVDAIKQAEVDLARYDINVLMIDLPLHCAETKIVPELLRKEGYIFGGVMPLFHQERDYLRMQKLKCELDLHQIFVFSKMAKKIKNLVTREWNEIPAEKRTVER